MYRTIEYNQFNIFEDFDMIGSLIPLQPLKHQEQKRLLAIKKVYKLDVTCDTDK